MLSLFSQGVIHLLVAWRIWSFVCSTLLIPQKTPRSTGHVGFLGGQGISADITMGCVVLSVFDLVLFVWNLDFHGLFWRNSVLYKFCVEIDQTRMICVFKDLVKKKIRSGVGKVFWNLGNPWCIHGTNGIFTYIYHKKNKLNVGIRYKYTWILWITIGAWVLKVIGCGVGKWWRLTPPAATWAQGPPTPGLDPWITGEVYGKMVFWNMFFFGGCPVVLTILTWTGSIFQHMIFLFKHMCIFGICLFSYKESDWMI